MKRRAALLACAALLGCDAQATQQYSGEPLLRVRGRVELLQARGDGASLLPAVAFRGGDGKFRLIDVDARGAFPAEFVMDVLEPPPAESLLHVDNAAGETRLAVGYITAVKDDLPRVFTYTEVDEPSTGEIVDGGMAWEPEPEPPIWASFAGLSQNYLVLYLEARAPEGSVIAHHLGAARQGVSAGYQLIAVRDETDEEAEARGHCEIAAYALALERLNAAHGTRYVEEDFERFCEADDPDCAGQYEAELSNRQAQARVELDCRDSDLVLTHVAQPDAERITVRIGQDVEPLN